MEEYLTFLKDIIFHAGSIAKNQHENIKIYNKGTNDFVTNVDIEINQYIEKEINENFPSHNIISEENMSEYRYLKNKEFTWIIDPIDGTTNYIHQGLNYTVSIALCKNNEVIISAVYDPTREELFHAIKNKGAYLNDKKIEISKIKSLNNRLVALSWNSSKQISSEPFVITGLRNLGCASLEMVYVAAGRIGMVIYERLQPWDFGAAKLIVEESGGIVKNIEGNNLNLNEKSSVLTASIDMYKELKLIGK
ncbi:inositol monophosphatase [Bacillus wiedmannii]|uniref:inositol monophosphatase family protein n=1 Tax=Bacillus wiedmannii TaxID=1890302 RepID=UPI000BF2CBD6|nr:inositol monophosphatase family protein [Bacillus wiedmannii]PEP92445.1 inositol monophosphatase [Bacillus wiedmannii]